MAATTVSLPTSMANAIRALAMDAVQQANSGHPGAPMGMAEMAVALWDRHLKYNPGRPDAGPIATASCCPTAMASMLLYALLHLSGYALDDGASSSATSASCTARRRATRKSDVTPGVETTTGPLGQGISNAVGMALAEKLLAHGVQPRPATSVVDHHTYAFLGDGCMMEGISHEAVALAGAWKLNKLIALYDDNGISIDGQVAPWFIDNTPQRFAACGWNVIGPVDGHDIDAVDAAIAQAKLSADKPTLIVCKTHIGKGSPNRANTSKAHGEPLGAAEIALTREAIGWSAEPFTIPADVAAAWDCREAGAAAQAEWEDRYSLYVRDFPALAVEFERRMAGDLPDNFADISVEAVAAAHEKAETVASRKASQIALEHFTAKLPELLGGSADLTGSNLTNTKSTPNLRFDETGAVVKNEAGVGGRHINYGVREFGMAAIMNGIALHGGFIPYGGTFLTFSDYSRNAIRMAALMKQRVVHVFTHDSIGLGEDGPTHQSVEHAASLRLIPGLDVWRPADTCETAVAWTMALANRNRPSALLLSRQNLPYAAKTGADEITKGAYVLSNPSDIGFKKKDDKAPAAVIVATGSEVQLAVAAQAELAKDGIAVRVVSMPSTTVFDRQSVKYKSEVLPAGVPRIAVEAGVTDFWWKYGCAAVIGIDTYGESAPAGVLFQHFGFTTDNVVATVRKVLGK